MNLTSSTFSFSIALLLRLNSVSALLHPAPVQLSQNNPTSSNHSVPSNASLLEPTPPPGLRIHVSRSREEAFDLKDIWLSMVLLQSHLASFDNETIMSQSRQILLPLSRAYLVARGIELDLRFGEMVWGFYLLGVDFASLHTRQVPLRPFIADIHAISGPVGFIETSRGSVSAADNATIARRGALEARKPDRGQVVSPDYPDLTISYQFDGPPLNAGQVLTAFLKSMIFCSEHGSEALGVDMTAFSLDRLIRLRMTGEWRATEPDQLTWSRARFALRLLWTSIIMDFDLSSGGRLSGEPRFETMSYLILYQGQRIGQGWIG